MKLPNNAVKLSNDFDIWEIPNFATDEECDTLIKEAYDKGFQTSEVDDPKAAITKARTSTTSFLTTSQSPTGQKLGDRIKEVIGKHPLEGLQVQKYEVGQKYNPHFDTFDNKDGKDQRNWTGIVYLNNVEEGGGTYFPNVNIRVFPKKGMLILWNNLNSQHCREQKTLHMGEPVIKGQKYISTFWYRKSGSKETMCPDSSSFNRIGTSKNKNVVEQFNNLSTGNKCGAIIGVVALLGILGLLLYFLIKLSYKSPRRRK